MLDRGLNALYMLIKTVISFYLHYINIFVLSELSHYSDSLLHHLVQKKTRAERNNMHCNNIMKRKMSSLAEI